MSHKDAQPLLQQLDDALSHFEQLLYDEASALKQPEPQQLIDLSQQKSELSQSLERLTERLQTEFGLEINRTNEPAISAALQQKIHTCNQLNQRNGLVIQTLLSTNAQLMNLLVSNLSPSLYNATGSRTKTEPQPSTLAKA
ncbi:MAG: flagellar export chaperone FlgN [Thiomicrospira sp.]|jgi:flagellar biosynthesis/type III secretory pathway chaperone|nr:flagellar export chaperone FlgN [Thiomicrospira sp.]